MDKQYSITKNNDNYIIVIDGVAGTGKSTLAKELAKKLNILYINTGLMYRAIGLYYIENNILVNEENIEKYINNIEINLECTNIDTKIYLNTRDVTDIVYAEKVSQTASLVSAYPMVRKIVVKIQNDIASQKSSVLEGRALGTLDFPNADLKIYLTADVLTRAKRRMVDLEKKGEIVDLNELIKSIEKRDIQDKTRKEAPLEIAKDAYVIDTTNITVDEMVDLVISYLKERVD